MRCQPLLRMFVVVAAVLLHSTARADPADFRLPAAAAEEVVAAAEAVRTIIRQGRPDELLSYISAQEGLQCSDAQVPYNHVKQDLQNKNSHLYIGLYDTKRFVAECSSDYSSDFPLVSDRQFFAESADSPIRIVDVSKDKLYVTVNYQSGPYASRKYTFHKEGTGWKLVDGLIVGACSCRG